jgi:hypothetical protein
MMPNQTTISPKTIADLHRELLLVQTELEWMREVLSANRFEGPWLSPADAAPLIGVSHDRILAEITAAERLRLLKKKTDLVYGEHYFNALNPHNPKTTKPTWKVHFLKFGEVLKRPPENRLIS